MNMKCKIGNIEKQISIYEGDNINLLGYDLTYKTFTNTFKINYTQTVGIYIYYHNRLYLCYYSIIYIYIYIL